MKAYGFQTKLTGVVAGSDASAIGVLNQARSFGLNVPTNLSIISIDGTEMCEMVQPQLASDSQKFYEIEIAGVKLGLLSQSLSSTINNNPKSQFLWLIGKA